MGWPALVNDEIKFASVYTAESAAVVPLTPASIEWKMPGLFAAGRPPVAWWKMVGPAAAKQDAFN